MAHALETGSNGEVAFASLRQPAWHGLGTVFESELTTSEMLKIAHLDNWNVRLESVSDLVPNYNFVSESFMVVRTNPFDQSIDVLSTVGER